MEAYLCQIHDRAWMAVEDGYAPPMMTPIGGGEDVLKPKAQWNVQEFETSKLLTTKIGGGPKKNFPPRYKEDMGIQTPSGYPEKGGIPIDPSTYPLQGDPAQQFLSFSWTPQYPDMKFHPESRCGALPSTLIHSSTRSILT